MARIVVIDDNPANARPLSRLLQYAGHEVDCLLRGAHAMETLRDERPDLLLLDVGMPDINGIELLRRIRDDPQLKDQRVIIYSGMTDPHVMDEAIDLGALDFVVKGAGWDGVLDRINAHLPH